MTITRPLPACFADLKTNSSRSEAMDGMRAIAALLVAAGHYGVISQNANKIPVWIFFGLSGYLLSEQGLKLDFGKLQVILYFLKRRIFRIYPLYFFAICLCGIFGSPNVSESGWNYFITRSTFFYAEGYFWTIKQEIIFYMTLPVIILVLLPLKANRIICAALLLIFAAITCTKPVTGYFSVAADQSNLKTLYFAPFLVGMAAAYLQEIISKVALLGGVVKLMMELTLYTALAIIIFINFSIPSGDFFHSELAIHSIINSMPLMLIILTLLRAIPQNPVARFFGLLPLRAIGIVGYSFYMWHWPINIILEKFYIFSGWPKLAVTGLITYLCACVTYCLIEKPLINFSKKSKISFTFKNKSVINKL